MITEISIFVQKLLLFLSFFQSKAIEDTVEDMLVRLDEFSQLADTVTNNR